MDRPKLLQPEHGSLLKYWRLIVWDISFRMPHFNTIFHFETNSGGIAVELVFFLFWLNFIFYFYNQDESLKLPSGWEWKIVYFYQTIISIFSGWFNPLPYSWYLLFSLAKSPPIKLFILTLKCVMKFKSLNWIMYKNTNN